MIVQIAYGIIINIYTNGSVISCHELRTSVAMSENKKRRIFTVFILVYCFISM